MTSATRSRLEPARRPSAFGTVDKLPSGRWRARYAAPDGKRRASTFATKSDARAWLSAAHADLTRRVWKAPEHGRRTVGSYAHDYLARTDLRESTKALYSDTWRLHLAERWGAVPVGEVTVSEVRAWHERASATTGPSALVHAYRLLRAVLNVAVRDEVLATNPARLRGAGTARSARASRSLTPTEVRALADAVPQRYRALVLVLAWGALRFGEATALRRCDVSPEGAVVTVERSVRHVRGRTVVGPPKTEAGRRTVALPPSVAETLAVHLVEHVRADPEALIFATRGGGYLARSNWAKTFSRAVSACGLPPVRSHELRHTGATLAAATGATTKELMARLGHASPAAALLYQHAASHRDAEIARALDALASA